MAVTRRYDDLLQVPIEEAWASRVRAVADREGISTAAVARQIIYAGMAARERISAGENASQEHLLDPRVAAVRATPTLR